MLDVMLALTPPPHLLEGTVSDVRLALEVIAAVFAVRVYREKPTKAFWLFRLGFLCLAVPHVGLLVFTGVAGFAFPEKLYQFRWIYWADPIAVMTFLILMSLSLRAVLHEPSSSGTETSNQAMQPTAGRRTISLSDD